jgi:hypothetical protein
MSESKHIFVFKPIGSNLTDVLKKEQVVEQFDPESRLTFKGRLDELASGILCITTGSNKEFGEIVKGCKKTYHFKLLISPNGFDDPKFKTDTYDVMGMPQENMNGYFTVGKNEVTKNNFIMKELEKRINECKSEEYMQRYPIYSSRTVHSELYQEKFGKRKKQPLWFLAQNECLPPFNEIPLVNSKVFDLRIEKVSMVKPDDMINIISEHISATNQKADNKFRQEEIISSYQDRMANNVFAGDFIVVDMVTTVGSGTYVRGICDYLGGVAINIQRTDLILEDNEGNEQILCHVDKKNMSECFEFGIL